VVNDSPLIEIGSIGDAHGGIGQCRRECRREACPWDFDELPRLEIQRLIRPARRKPHRNQSVSQREGVALASDYGLSVLNHPGHGVNRVLIS
jgi:hypothetical protein